MGLWKYEGDEATWGRRTRVVKFGDLGLRLGIQDEEFPPCWTGLGK